MRTNWNYIGWLKIGFNEFFTEQTQWNQTINEIFYKNEKHLKHIEINEHLIPFLKTLNNMFFTQIRINGKDFLYRNIVNKIKNSSYFEKETN